MAADFLGRTRELAALEKRLDQVRADGRGVAVALRGRRQVGKSRLVQEFCDRSGLPYLFFAATKGESPAESVRHFCAALNQSSLLDGKDSVPILESGSWREALGLLAAVIGDTPVIVVIDEVPWLAEQDKVFDGVLQTVWDRQLSAKPVLLCLLGSDIHMMERMTAYDQPFYGRAGNLVLGPFTPAETAAIVGLTGAAALDAHLVSGGLPGILRGWPSGTPALSHLRDECEDPLAPIFNVPETALMAEFPAPDAARRVLEAVGGGDRTHATIAAAAGSSKGAVPSGTLTPILQNLHRQKQVLQLDAPLSTRPDKPSLYRVADTSLRFYLGVLREAQDLARRGRPDQGIRIIERRWTSWRGRAIEPLIREALDRAASGPEFPWPDTGAVGGWWNRQFNPEIDLVGADRAPVAREIYFTGTIKWLGSPFDNHDLAAFATATPLVPGFVPGETGVVVVSQAGIKDGSKLDGIDLLWGPDDVLAAWQD